MNKKELEKIRKEQKELEEESDYFDIEEDEILTAG